MLYWSLIYDNDQIVRQWMKLIVRTLCTYFIPNTNDFSTVFTWSNKLILPTRTTVFDNVEGRKKRKQKLKGRWRILIRMRMELSIHPYDLVRVCTGFGLFDGVWRWKIMHVFHSQMLLEEIYFRGVGSCVVREYKYIYFYFYMESRPSFGVLYSSFIRWWWDIISSTRTRNFYTNAKTGQKLGVAAKSFRFIVLFWNGWLNPLMLFSSCLSIRFILRNKQLLHKLCQSLLEFVMRLKTAASTSSVSTSTSNNDTK